MQIERFRFVAEMLGITALVVSLIFVAFQMKQTQDMNMAQLEFDRLSLYHANRLAVLESDPMLSVVAKTRGIDWDAPDLTELEKAAALISADATIQLWRIEYKLVSLGFPIKVIPLEDDMRAEIQGNPAIEAAWNSKWEDPVFASAGFYGLMHKVFADK